ncbi:retrovirus-like pol polyprotein [Lasius niger]|uniref:RNA-directed DNA polymerase n=1 Tax=Lasius niger TaxID=67767 RepID=A0A0J7N271_LASNI|nr:retrovirus-like pol polyprotein [Lasius niger]
MIRLRQVLDTLRIHGLTLKLEKCSFFARSIEYLGREISEQGVRPGRRKIEAVLDMEAPRSVKQVRQFLGLAGYFRKFVENFAIVAEPLTRLTKKDVSWVWQEEQERAFNMIKSKLTTRPVLIIFNPEIPTEVHTDASAIGIGAILLQRVDGKMAAVAYYSRQTTADQRCYHSYELETMAVVLALRHFRVYLLGTKFKVVTDCNALRTTFAKRDLLPRIGRWWLEVQEYTFDVEYRAGTKMAHADALSRSPIHFPLEVLQIDITEGDWILAAQLQDEQLARIRTILLDKKATNETKHYFHEYLIKDNKIYRRLDDKTQAWVVPRDARMQICRLCHDDAGHLGVEKTLERIKRNYWFAGMRRFVTKYINACLNCAYYKHTAGKKQCKLNTIEKVPVPFHTVHIDHVGPFETSKTHNKFLLVIVDAFTKFTIIEPVKSQKTCYVVKILTNLIYLFGVPNRIISDRGTAFTSQAFRMFCDTYGIKHVLNAVATPRANGQCECSKF